ncbi:MAG: ABC transporter ATP-binding protein [Gammaproteobacteria bacterium]|nr:ABC transporter ATP-binding protein [Gammaproteobacteria bacterium]
MSDSLPAIRVDGLSKIYRIGVRDLEADNLVTAVSRFIRNPITNYKKYRSLYNFDDVLSGDKGNNQTDSSDILWALKDVSFKVEQGELVGIIGRNGAGKSTLLKILSRITPPTKGTATIQGRVSSLLEVGTGFHPELTGRDNVYLNGTILGMRKHEVDSKFDEIVEFSGVEKFLDTPVKRYSSGMRVRLAFAVAAHLEPEILIIDEVLAVGDSEFQKKCMGKMQEVGRQGRTVLFVSHSMPSVTRMCSRVIMLDQGGVRLDGTPHEVVRSYLKGDADNIANREWSDDQIAPRGDIVRLRAVRLRDEQDKISEAFDIRYPIGVEVEYEVIQPGYTLAMSFSLIDEQGNTACEAMDQDKAWRGRQRPVGRYISTGWISGNFLGEGMYMVNVYIHTLEPKNIVQVRERDAVGFQVIDSLEGDSARGDFRGVLRAPVRPAFTWNTQADVKE